MFKFILIVIVASVLTIVNTQRPWACFGVTGSGFVRNSKSCQSYWFCSGTGVTVEGTCPEGYYFEPLNQSCEHPSIVDCTACSRGGIQTIADPTDCTKYFCCSQGVRTQITCPGGNTIFDPNAGCCIAGDPSKCNVCSSIPGSATIGDSVACDVYHVCVNGTGFRQQCPPGLVFSPTTRMCDLRANVPVCWGDLPVPPTN